MSSTLRPARSGSSSPCRGGVWETPGVRILPGRSIVWYQNVDATLARSSSTFTGGAAPLRRHRPVAVARGKALYVFGANTEHTDRVERRHDSRRTARSRASARTPEGYHRGRGASWPGTASNQTNMARYSSPTSDLLFTAPQGGPYSPRNFARRVWEPAVEHAGLEPLRIHDYADPRVCRPRPGTRCMTACACWPCRHNQRATRKA